MARDLIAQLAKIVDRELAEAQSSQARFCTRSCNAGPDGTPQAVAEPLIPIVLTPPLPPTPGEPGLMVSADAEIESG